MADDDEPSPPPCISMCVPARLPARRLSGIFRRPPLAWEDFRGRLLLGAEEATSARAVGLLGAGDVPWEGLSPLQTLLLVAVVAVATAESRQRMEVERLRRLLKHKDQLLQSLQQKFEDLCDQTSPAMYLFGKNILDWSDAEIFQSFEMENYEKKRTFKSYSDQDSFDINLSCDSFDINLSSELELLFNLEDAAQKPCSDEMAGFDHMSSMEPENLLLQSILLKFDDLCDRTPPAVYLSNERVFERSDANMFQSLEPEDYKKKRSFKSYSDQNSFDINLSSELEDAVQNSCSNEMGFNLLNSMDPEERRMSYLSDFCPSVTSSMDTPNECKEKDALNATSVTSNCACSKRLSKAKKIIQRQNYVITQLRKDVAFFAQQTRKLSGSPFSSQTLKFKCFDVPVMSNNILYDVSSNNSSSSDSEASKMKKKEDWHSIDIQTDQPDGVATTVKNKKSLSTERHSCKSRDVLPKQQYVRRFKEMPACQQFESVTSSRPKNSLSPAGILKKPNKHMNHEKKNVRALRKWV